MKKSENHEIKYKEILQELEIHFKSSDKVYELRVPSDLFNREFIGARLAPVYDVKFIAHVEQSKQFFYDIKLKNKKDVRVKEEK